MTSDKKARSLRGTRYVLEEPADFGSDVICGALEAANEVGSGIGATAKGAVIGIIRGVGEITTVTFGVLSDTVRAAVKGTGDVGGDVGRVARNAAEGGLGVESPQSCLGAARAGTLYCRKHDGDPSRLSGRSRCRSRLFGCECGAEGCDELRHLLHRR